MYDELYAIETEIRTQAQTRKTLDKGILQAYIVQQANAQQRRLAEYWPANKERVQQAQRQAEHMMFLLDCYGGFQTRTWEVFVSLPLWYDIVRALIAYDKTHSTHHYGGLLRVLEKFNRDAPKFYGKQAFEPTYSERVYVRRVYDRYVAVLGLD